MPKLLRPLIVKQLKYDLTPVAGLALVGHYLRALQPEVRHFGADFGGRFLAITSFQIKDLQAHGGNLCSGTSCLSGYWHASHVFD